jgi:hypothetical protein
MEGRRDGGMKARRVGGMEERRHRDGSRDRCKRDGAERLRGGDGGM